MRAVGRALPLILIVEDFEELYELYSDFLAGVGFAVEGTSNGVEAITVVERVRPDLILLDLALPQGLGCDAIALIKNDAQTHLVPIIALAGHVQRRYGDLARQAGADLVLPKPCALDLLLGEIERLLRYTAPARAP